MNGVDVMQSRTAVQRDLALTQDQTYTLAQGDNLVKLAQEAYGKPNLWRSIYDHNRKVLGRNPKKLNTDVTITVPSLSTIIAKNRSRTQVLWAFEASQKVEKPN
jgi:nucleoid-associated protein YgaU